MTDSSWLIREFQSAIPAERESSVVRWAEQHVKVFGARGEEFKSEATPWTVEPLERGDDGVTRMITFVKPVQSGGSVVGEALLSRWISCHYGGDVQYNWEDDIKAGERWMKRVEKIFKACGPLMELAPRNPDRWRKGLVIFPHLSFTMQGVVTDSNVASDSIRFQVNEEIHNWTAGRLKQAFNRTTAYWNSVTVNISNAGLVGDQLHVAFDSGTQQPWEVKCPGCRQYHVMQTRWDDKRPDLGGLRYDAEKRDTGDYSYQQILSTLRYQMPCGALIHESPTERRALSLSGRYGEPLNLSAPLTNRSYTLDGVSVDYIPWIKLIEEKHDALRALRYGDPEPFKTYTKERECRFWDPEERPLVGKIVLTSSVKKNRDGLHGHTMRAFALDRQQGTLKLGELPHWWLVIRDIMPNGDSLLVFEGKLKTDADAIGVLKEHGCTMRWGVADSGDDTRHVYQFCLEHGINAIKGGDEMFYRHPNGAKRIFSEEKPLHAMIGAPSVFPYQLGPIGSKYGMVPHKDEPLFWHYSKVGLLDRLAYLRGKDCICKWEVPADVSDDYKKHMEAWELDETKKGISKEVVHTWRQVRKRDDLNKCEQYIAMLFEMAGLIGERK
jgi:hypothetical protein